MTGKTTVEPHMTSGTCHDEVLWALDKGWFMIG